MNMPIQPIEEDANGVLRFKANALVKALLEHGQRTGLCMNDLAVCYRTESYANDWQQLAQLIGYSLSGYGELSYVDDAAYDAAYAEAIRDR
jgi:hypothetical protein